MKPLRNSTQHEIVYLNRYWNILFFCQPRIISISHFLSHPCNALIAFCGSAFTIRSSALAGPVGWRRACSQFSNVHLLRPIKVAKRVCDKPVLSLIAFTSGSEKLNCLEAYDWPFTIPSICSTLFSNSLNMSLSI